MADIETLEVRVKRLEDREEIWKLITDFRRHVDTRDFAAFASLFSKRGQLLTNLGPPATGPAEIEALVEQTLERFEESQRTFHHVTNSAIEVSGDEATAESTWTYVARDEDDKPVLTFAGHYSDVFTREDGAWKFLRRAVYLDMPFEPFDRPAAAARPEAN
jgi:uncharacterized protein (TIGR02246 family)